MNVDRLLTLELIPVFGPEWTLDAARAAADLRSTDLSAPGFQPVQRSSPADTKTNNAKPPTNASEAGFASLLFS